MKEQTKQRKILPWDKRSSHKGSFGNTAGIEKDANTLFGIVQAQVADELHVGTPFLLGHFRQTLQTLT